MPSSSGKVVQKVVKKYVQNWWIKNVQKYQKVEFLNVDLGFTSIIHNIEQVFQEVIDRNCTYFLQYSPLLRLSFTPFPHRSTITTTYYLIKEEKCR